MSNPIFTRVRNAFEIFDAARAVAAAVESGRRPAGHHLERLGIDHLRRVVVDDEEGIAADLDQRMQDAVDSYVDPWLEADPPVHPAQFVDVVGVGVAGGGRRR